MPRTRRVALYARTSTSRDQSPAMQLSDLRQAASERGWVVVGEYVDHGFSGTTDKRPELDRLMNDIRKGGPTSAGIVLAWRFNRFGRSVRHLVTALDEFRTRGIEFASLKDGIDTSTPSGRFTFHLVAALAEMEATVIRSRVQSGVDAARRRGTRLGRPPADVDVERARELLARPGASLRKVAAALGVGASTLSRALRTASVVEIASAPKSPSHEAFETGRISAVA